MKRTLFEKMFPYHVEQVTMCHGKDAAGKYAKWADPILQRYIFLIFSFITIIVFNLIGLWNCIDLLDSLFTLCLLLAFHCVDKLLSLRKIRKDCLNDEHITKIWIKATVSVLVPILLSSVFTIVSIISMLDLSSLKKETIYIKSIGYTITIPRVWSDAIWDSRPNYMVKYPYYSFHVIDDDRTMWFNLYGWNKSPETRISDLEKETFNQDVGYLDDGFLEKSCIMTINGREVHRSIGKRKDHPNHIYVCYRTLQQGTLLCYTFAFPNSMNYDRQLAYADSMFENMEFAEIRVPDYVYQRDMHAKGGTSMNQVSIRDMRPADYRVTDEHIEIMSAHMKIPFPEDYRSLNWKTNTRSAYRFDLDMGCYKLFFDLTVVWTSENATVNDELDGFTNYAHKYYDSSIMIRPSIVRIGSIMAVREAGVRKSSPDVTEIRYCIYHKGSRLYIAAQVPSSCKFMAEASRIESYIKEIDFY